MEELQNLNADEFSAKILNDENAIIIDVRTQQEFESGHISNALLFDIYSPKFSNKILELDKSKNYYVYCRSGNRSFHAGTFMLSEGFNSVYNLEDGIISWKDKLES